MLWHLFAHSTTHDRHRRPLELHIHGRENKKNLIVVSSWVCLCVFFFSQQAWICLQDEVIVLSVYRTKRKKPFHKPNGYMDDFDVNEVKNCQSFGFESIERLCCCSSSSRMLIWLWLSNIESPYFDFFKCLLLMLMQMFPCYYLNKYTVKELV